MIKQKTVVSFVFLVIFSVSFAFAQTGSIKGLILDKTNGEPVGFASVLIKGTAIGTVSEENGFFSLSKVPYGQYQLRITCVGYDSLIADVEVSAKNTAVLRFFLSQASVSIEGVSVSAEKIISQTETKVSINTVTAKQILRLPAMGGISDLAQYIQVLPGVVFTGDQGGQLYIRGGTPIQNKVLIDGLTIYNPFHSIGLFSVFETEIIKNAKVYTAGFNAEHGGRVSSIMEISTRDGNRKRFSGKVEASTFAAGLLLEGPFLKQTEKSKQSISYLFSLKGSYLEQTSKWFYPYSEDKVLPYNYLDGYGKISFETPNGSRINFFGFCYNDRVRYPSIATYNWQSWGVGSSFVLIPSATNMIAEGTIAYSSYNMTLSEENLEPRVSKINNLDFKMDFSYLIGKSTFSYGIELLGSWTDYHFTSAYGYNISQTNFNADFALYAKYKWVIKKFLIEPGFRMQAYPSQSHVSPEPRLAIKYNITDNVRLKLAAGLYSQNIIGATSDQDVVNLFYGFLTVPESIVGDTLKGRKVKNSLQKAQHAVFGVEYDFAEGFSSNIEAYVKNFSQLTNINRYKLFDSDNDFLLETGIAYGGDISIKYERKGLYISAVYSLNWVTRDDGIIVYRTHYDRRHNLNLMVSYAWGKNNCWQADARWNYGTGFPFTKTKGFYPRIGYIETIDGDIIQINEELGVALDTLNRGQLPDYHRLDISIKRRFLFSDRMSMEVGAGATNVYNYHNIFYVNRITAKKIYQLPILWTVNASFRF
ncbi:MAG: TonB-dependent receptor [Bacteroidales bacterium]|jgi:hypothetical protein|nr:TonB-dependent receptor [Bacteroidales bacterium]